MCPWDELRPVQVSLWCSSTRIIKYSDDTAILALLTEDVPVLDYNTTISHFTHWCDNNHLHLNVAQTKELIIRPTPQHPRSTTTKL